MTASQSVDPPPPPIGPLLWARLRGRHLIWLLLASLAMLGGAIAANYPAILSGKIVDQIVERDVTSFAATIPFLLGLLAAYVVRELAAVFRKFLVERTACDLERDELQRISRFLLHLDLSAFLGQRIGGLNVRIHRSLEGLIKFVKLLFLDLLPTLALSVVALVLTGQQSVIVLGVMLAIFVVAFAVTVVQVWTQKGIRLALFAVKEEVSANLTEVLQGLDYVRAAGATVQETERADVLAKRLREQEFRHHKWMMSFDGIKQLLEGIGLVLVVGIGAWQAANGQISSGSVLTLALLYGSVAAPLRDLHRIIDEGFEGVLKIRELAALYRLLPDVGIPGTQPLAADVTLKPVIEVEDLALTVADDVVLLDGVCISVSSGEWVGFAGGSGSGKTTLIKTIIGMTPQYRGSIKVFGEEVRTVEKERLWAAMGYVGQSPYVIKGSLRENLVYGLRGSMPSDDQLLEALNRAGLGARFAARGVKCLEDKINEQGRGLSGGERQRLAVARLFLRAPSILILDEATSALDYENERELVRALREAFPNATALVIAHRVEALRDTDRIVVMRGGGVVEEGRFAELVERGGEFAKITNLRKADFER
ncbi:ABC transporter ATP-binding protein [Sphingomonas canadensis]|uniref:ABC transporter ATP-binding protein n=1 Tax=Sphingomonas canadensis TaxID=1219257 RepID=A0ABW3H0W2_9SPHN|nr:ABC transporter ATP-binding protein [Sphingomonas canadensis]MCW3835031.1 ABC transporter ATP-binding protein/permease [Sphingomonas canadensis]